MGAGATLPTLAGISNALPGPRLNGGAAINGPAGKVYFGDDGNPGTIYKFSTGAGALAPGPNPDSNLPLPAGGPRVAAIDVVRSMILPTGARRVRLA